MAPHLVQLSARRVRFSNVVSHEEPFSDQVTRDLEALKLQLAAMKTDDLPENRAREIAREISAIRLHLKRLEADREWVKRFAKPLTQ